MMAVILAGGKGTRLKPFTMTLPKPLLPLGEMPILEIIIRQLVAAQITRIVLTVGHLHHLFMASIGDGAQWGAQIEYAQEEAPCGTAGPLRTVPQLEEHFLVMMGDILTTLDYRALLDHHHTQAAAATIATSHRQVTIDYGVIVADPQGQLREYQEKPVIPYAVSMGINVLSRRCLDFLPPTGKFDMPELMQAIVRANQRVVCYPTTCYWQDIGRFDDYQRASDDFVRDPAQFLPRESR